MITVVRAGCRIVGRCAWGIRCASKTTAMSAMTVTNTASVAPPDSFRSSSPGTFSTLSPATGPVSVTYRSRVTRAAEPKRAVEVPEPGARGRVATVRARVRALPGGTLAWRIGVTALGLAVVVVGVILLPLPGPGWLIIFAGLGLLATEYRWASRLLSRARAVVLTWTKWAATRGLWTRIGIGAAGLLILAGVFAGSWYLYTHL
ncbi:MAG: hypothetical protein JWO57_2790 [Pseudonocardiales bacterium]|nr:hypothetical protein [Pseudonocardiales bacterium]